MRDHMPIPVRHACRNCKHFQPREGLNSKAHCRASPRKENLKSFPFNNTTCRHWVKK